MSADAILDSAYGLCQCGCGGKAPIARATAVARGRKRGEPLRFIHGHGGRRSVADRFWAKVQRASDEDCWLWTAGLNSDGYGDLTVDGRHVKAHRVSYELLVGPIPEGLVIDHLCRVRHCVNPAHLEPVTNLDNIRRGYRHSVCKTECINGHPFSEENAYRYGNKRACLACRKTRAAAYYQAKKEAGKP